MRGSSPSLRAASAAASACSRAGAARAVPGTVAPGRGRAGDSAGLGGEFDLAHENAADVAAGTREAFHISFRLRVEIDRQECDGPAFRRRERGAQRLLVAHCQEDVDLARGECAIVFFVAVDIRRLDVIEYEIAALLVADRGHPPEKISVEGRVAGLNADKAEPQHFRLLRARRKRPSDGAEHRDESAATDKYGARC